ncbi:MAG: hypothetical protein QOJ00_1126 [Actinomycetota bacterium]|jgi:hypothetical protein
MRVTQSSTSGRSNHNASDTTFVVRGVCDGHLSTAHWRSSALTASIEVMRRVQAAVDDGEWFGYDSGEVVEASVSGDYLAALLAVMRAFDRVDHVDLRHGRSNTAVGVAEQQRDAVG